MHYNKTFCSEAKQLIWSSGHEATALQRSKDVTHISGGLPLSGCLTRLDRMGSEETNRRLNQPWTIMACIYSGSSMSNVLRKSIWKRRRASETDGCIFRRRPEWKHAPYEWFMHCHQTTVKEWCSACELFITDWVLQQFSAQAIIPCEFWKSRS